MNTMEADDAFELLEVDSTMTMRRIRKCYRKKMGRNHPDLHPDNTEHYEEQCKLIGEAFIVIKQVITGRNTMRKQSETYSQKYNSGARGRYNSFDDEFAYTDTSSVIINVGSWMIS